MRDPPLPFYTPPTLRERLEHEAAKPYSARLKPCQSDTDTPFCPYHHRQTDALDCQKAAQAAQGTNQMRERI